MIVDINFDHSVQNGENLKFWPLAIRTRCEIIRKPVSHGVNIPGTVVVRRRFHRQCHMFEKRLLRPARQPPGAGGQRNAAGEGGVGHDEDPQRNRHSDGANGREPGSRRRGRHGGDSEEVEGAFEPLEKLLEPPGQYGHGQRSEIEESTYQHGEFLVQPGRCGKFNDVLNV